MQKLVGKTALFTGSTDGVGRLVARKLGQAGARVLVHGRDAERGTRVVADIKASGGATDFLAADLAAAAPELSRIRRGRGLRQRIWRQQPVSKVQPWWI
jgi:NAD(P)-dependent dehydrogenase (short-subunit alcohol dehydrogenase family)